MVESIVSQYIAKGRIDAQNVEQKTYLGMVECSARCLKPSYVNLISIFGAIDDSIICAHDKLIAQHDFIPEKDAVHMFACYYKFTKVLAEPEIRKVLDALIEDCDIRCILDKLKSKGSLVRLSPLSGTGL